MIDTTILIICASALYCSIRLMISSRCDHDMDWNHICKKCHRPASNIIYYGESPLREAYLKWKHSKAMGKYIRTKYITAPRSNRTRFK